MPILNKRLTLAAEMLGQVKSVADIGTDHAFLPIALIKSGVAKKVIACDIAEGPLNVAAKNVKKSGVEGIELRLSDGLAAVSENEVNVVTVAGMGGDLISRILTAAPWVKNPEKRLVLQAMTSADSLRDYLYAEGFRIITELAVTDAGRVYSVITAEYDGICRVPSEAERLIGGLINDPSNDATKYITIQLKRISDCAESLKTVERKAEEYKFAIAARDQLFEILKTRK